MFATIIDAILATGCKRIPLQNVQGNILSLIIYIHHYIYLTLVRHNDIDRAILVLRIDVGLAIIPKWCMNSYLKSY